MGIPSRLFYLFLGLLSHIFSVLGFLISVVYRPVVHIILCVFYNNKYKLIKTGFSTVVAADTEGTPNVLYVLKCKGTPNLAQVVQKLYRAVKYETKKVSGGECDTSYRPFEKLGYVIVPKFGLFCWKLDHRFRAENHVVFDKVSNNLDIEVQRRAERMNDKIYGDYQPQWKLHVLFREKAKEYALIWSVHHTFSDATIFTQVIRHALADSLFPMKFEPLEWNRKKENFLSKIRSYLEPAVLCTFGSLYLAGVYSQCLGQETIKENTLTEKRGRCHYRDITLDLSVIKTIQRKASEVKPVRFVSVLFACLAPAINRGLSSSEKKKPTTVLASTVEANYPYPTLSINNNITSLWFDLPLNIKSMHERLSVIDRNVRQITGHLGMTIFKTIIRVSGATNYHIRRILEDLGSLSHTTYISNIVGPEKPFTVLGGDPVTSIYVYSPVCLNEAVTIVSYTYADQITISMVAPDRVVSKLPGFLDNIEQGFKDELDKYSKFSWGSEKH